MPRVGGAGEIRPVYFRLSDSNYSSGTIRGGARPRAHCPCDLDLLSRTASRISALRASSSIVSPCRKSIARIAFPSRHALKSLLGSFNCAPLGNVSLAALFNLPPMQTIPSCDQTGTPVGFEGRLHFTSSTTFGSALNMTARKVDNVLPCQSPGSLIMASICLEGGLFAEGPGFAVVLSSPPSSRGRQS